MVHSGIKSQLKACQQLVEAQSSNNALSKLLNIEPICTIAEQRGSDEPLQAVEVRTKM